MARRTAFSMAPKMVSREMFFSRCSTSTPLSNSFPFMYFLTVQTVAFSRVRKQKKWDVSHLHTSNPGCSLGPWQTVLSGGRQPPAQDNFVHQGHCRPKTVREQG